VRQWKGISALGFGIPTDRSEGKGKVYVHDGLIKPGPSTSYFFSQIDKGVKSSFRSVVGHTIRVNLYQ
jgi:hypothetical protein